MTNETNKQLAETKQALAETKQALAETKQLRGTFDQVIRQINETYNASNGWAIARTSSVLVNFSVWLERSVKQAPTTNKEVDNEIEDGVYKDEQATVLETTQKDVVEDTKVEAAPKTTAKRTVAKK